MSKDLRPCILYQFLHTLVKSTTLKTLPFNRKQHFVLTSRIHLVIHKKNDSCILRFSHILEVKSILLTRDLLTSETEQQPGHKQTKPRLSL